MCEIRGSIEGMTANVQGRKYDAKLRSVGGVREQDVGCKDADGESRCMLSDLVVYWEGSVGCYGAARRCPS